MDDGHKPTIDERLDRLTERHEALTQTVELIAAAQIKNEADIGKLTALMAETGRFINRLAHIAEAHDQRLDRREGQ
jgi:hypothetical protein